MCRSLVINKIAGGRYNINIKLLIQLHFFIAPFVKKSKFFPPLTQCDLSLHNCKSGNYLHFANIISNVRNCGDDLRKNFKLKQDKDHCPKCSSYMDFLLQFKAGVGSFFCWNFAFLKYDKFHVLSKLHCFKKNQKKTKKTPLYF